MNVNFDNCVEVSGDRLGKDAAYILNCKKLRNTFDWSPSIELEQGIQECITWVQENLKTLVKLPQSYIHKR